MDVHLELQTVPKVTAPVILSVSWAYFISSRIRPGFPRLLALLPALSLFPFLPMLFTSIHFRNTSGFLISWLCLFKLLLLCFGQGPLDPSLPFISFLSIACLPVKLPAASAPGKQTSFNCNPLSLNYLLNIAVKAASLAALVSLYRFKDRVPSYMIVVFLCFHSYLSLELLYAAFSVLAGALLGMELETHFNKSFLSSSLRDFWGRRWNLMVSAILRVTVYNPLRNCIGKSAAIIATFGVSGVMHELMFYYYTLLLPTGVVLLWFIFHGICRALEGWWARHESWWRPPKLLATVGTLAFVTGTII